MVCPVVMVSCGLVSCRVVSYGRMVVQCCVYSDHHSSMSEHAHAHGHVNAHVAVAPEIKLRGCPFISLRCPWMPMDVHRCPRIGGAGLSGPQQWWSVWTSRTRQRAVLLFMLIGR